MLVGMNIDAITADTITGLIAAGAQESVHLEFKRQSYGTGDDAKREFLKDVSAFANSLGGHLVIGMEETGGRATEVRPMPAEVVDSEMLRLESVLRTGIDPALVGVRMRRIDVEGGAVIVIQVPQSYNPPHRVIQSGSNRFWRRHSSGAHEMSMEELRLLFGERRSIEERARAFVAERFLRIGAGEGAMPVPVERGVLVMHLVPLPDFGTRRRIELAALGGQEDKLLPIGAFGPLWRVNLEGFCVYRRGSVCHGYTQVFRDGSIEATSGHQLDTDDQGQKYFFGKDLLRKLIDAAKSYMTALRTLGATPPVLLNLSAMNMAGARMVLRNGSAHDVQYPRDTLHLPSSIIEAYAKDGDYQPVIAEQMHVLWNAFGLDRCPYFDAGGRLTAED